MLKATHKIIDQIKLNLGDRDNGAFTDIELNSFIDNCIIMDQTITLQKSKNADIYYSTYVVPLYQSTFAVDPAFLGTGITEDMFRYSFDEYSLVYKPTSTETRSTISISGIIVNFPEIMFKVYKALATDAARIAYSASLDGESFNKESHYRNMMHLAEQWRGVVLV
jgi:hypothetical protein